MKRIYPLLLMLLLWPSAAPALIDDGATRARWQRYAATAGETEPAMAFPHEACFRRAAAAHGVPLTLLLAVARGESDFDPNARSSADALGLMQILWPGTAHHLGLERRTQLFDPCTNVDAGARYLKELLARYDGDLHLTLAAYNYGPGRIEQGARRLPEKARWYSAYILRHLDYVLGKGGGRRGGSYGGEGRLELIRFARPYRAAALVESLHRRRPGLRLDLFRRPRGSWCVVLLYADAEERQRGLSVLRSLGLGVTG